MPVFAAFMSGIPEELMQAAKTDGAGPLRTFWSIVMPVSRANFVPVDSLPESVRGEGGFGSTGYQAPRAQEVGA